MKRLVVIDGHAILHRAYHALPPLTTSKGEMVNAVYGFTAMLIRVIADLKPTHLAVVFDLPTPTFRNKLFKEYQSQRPKIDDELASQIDIVHRVVKELGIPIFEVDGYEADDVIGTIAKKWEMRSGKLDDEVRSEKDPASHVSRRTSGSEAVIVTGDRDMLQLVDDKTKIYMPIKGLSESKLYGKKEVEEKFGIKPQQFVDYKSLVGDPSDNYPGVAGIGPKTASGLLQRFKSLERIYKNIKEIESEKVKKALDDYLESAEMAKKLATIVTNVPIKMDIEKCKLPHLDKPNVHHLFEELEFRSLIPRLSGGIAKHSTFNIQHSTGNKKEEKNDQQISLF